MKLRLFVALFCTVGSTLLEGMELVKDDSLQKIQSSIQHVPQEVTVEVFHFVDYPTLAQSRQVCKLWKTLIDEKLPLPQRYILKYLSQFVQRKDPERTIKRFEEIFLALLSYKSARKTVLEDIIDELQDELSCTKEQAYQALLNRKIVSTSPSIELEIYAGKNLELERKFDFPYIPVNLFKQEDLEHVIDQNIKLRITGKQGSPMQIFGIGNLPTKVLDRVATISLDKTTLLKIPRQLQKLQKLSQFGLINSQLSRILAEIGQLTKLQELYLEYNQLSRIPAKIGQLTNLQVLYLGNNQLSSIPAEIGQLTNLQKLYLYCNQLSNIPVEIGQLTNLQELHLGGNQLSSIPVEIGQITNLQWLNLSHNKLSSIPAEIKKALPNCSIISYYQEVLT